MDTHIPFHLTYMSIVLLICEKIIDAGLIEIALFLSSTLFKTTNNIIIQHLSLYIYFYILHSLYFKVHYASLYCSYMQKLSHKGNELAKIWQICVGTLQISHTKVQ